MRLVAANNRKRGQQCFEFPGLKETFPNVVFGRGQKGDRLRTSYGERDGATAKRWAVCHRRRCTPVSCAHTSTDGHSPLGQPTSQPADLRFA